MTRVAQVNLAYNVRTLWFDPNGVEIESGDKLVVETARGTEMGVAASEIIEVTEEEIENLKSPLKPVLRKATQEDIEKAQEMERLAAEAMPVFMELASEVAEDMHPVSVEYLLSGDKAVFYFESEDRVDFRDLVRQLAARLHVRIDMRQIGVRDEARIVGGLAHCGQVVCCKRLGGEFNPVSIRMAKNQDLSLNPQKISGLCGRLMCCLRYEDEAYREFKGRAPKIGSEVETPDGMAQVVELNVPRETVKLRVGEEKPVNISLADFDMSKNGKRPNTVDPEAWEEAKTEDVFAINIMATFQTSQFTGNDKLGSARAIHHETSHGKDDMSPARSRRKSERSENDEGMRGFRNEGGNAKKRSGRRKNGAGDISAPEDRFSSKTDTTRKPRKRKSTTISAGNASDINTQFHKDDKGSKGIKGARSTKSYKGGNSRNNNCRRGLEKNADESNVVLRPGHRSSGLANMEGHTGARTNGSNGSKGSQNRQAQQGDGRTGGNRRKPRRRSHRS